MPGGWDGMGWDGRGNGIGEAENFEMEKDYDGIVDRLSDKTFYAMYSVYIINEFYYSPLAQNGFVYRTFDRENLEI